MFFLARKYRHADRESFMRWYVDMLKPNKALTSHCFCHRFFLLDSNTTLGLFSKWPFWYTIEMSFIDVKLGVIPNMDFFSEFFPRFHLKTLIWIRTNVVVSGLLTNPVDVRVRPESFNTQKWTKLSNSWWCCSWNSFERIIERLLRAKMDLRSDFKAHWRPCLVSGVEVFGSLQKNWMRKPWGFLT